MGNYFDEIAVWSCDFDVFVGVGRPERIRNDITGISWN